MGLGARPGRGAVGVFKFQNAERKTINVAKRVLALEGETVFFKSGEIYVNGESVSKRYNLPVFEKDSGILKVPAGHVFFGDNTKNIFDRLHYGAASVSIYIGTGQFIGLSANESEIRLERIGVLPF
jgi:signal peptidase I